MTRSPLFIAITAVRSTVFHVFFFAWLFGASLIGYILTFLPFRKLFLAWSYIWVAGVAFLERTLLGLDFRMRGQENLPPAPYVMAMQHQSAWETCKLAYWFPLCAIVLKEELLSIPLWGRCMKHYGCIPVKRSKKPEDLKRFLKIAKEMVADHRTIIIYPQGTRAAPGQSVPYNKGVTILQDSFNLPVVPVTLNSGEFWGKASFLKYAGTVDVKIHPPIAPGLSREELISQLKKLYEG